MYFYEQGSNGKSHFIFVTNLAPCSGVRVHLWPQKGNLPSDLPAGKSVLEVTSKMVQIPAGQAPRQVLRTVLFEVVLFGETIVLKHLLLFMLCTYWEYVASLLIFYM